MTVSAVQLFFCVYIKVFQWLSCVSKLWMDGWMDEPSRWMKFELAFFLRFLMVLIITFALVISVMRNFKELVYGWFFLESIMWSSLDSSNDNSYCRVVSRQGGKDDGLSGSKNNTWRRGCHGKLSKIWKGSLQPLSWERSPRFQHKIKKLQWKTKNKPRFLIIHIGGRKVATFQQVVSSALLLACKWYCYLSPNYL